MLYTLSHQQSTKHVRVLSACDSKLSSVAHAPLSSFEFRTPIILFYFIFSPFILFSVLVCSSERERAYLCKTKFWIESNWRNSLSCDFSNEVARYICVMCIHEYLEGFPITPLEWQVFTKSDLSNGMPEHLAHWSRNKQPTEIMMEINAHNSE